MQSSKGIFVWVTICHFAIKKSPKQHGQKVFRKIFKKIITFEGKKI
jgi:hypothetical protein